METNGIPWSIAHLTLRMWCNVCEDNNWDISLFDKMWVFLRILVKKSDRFMEFATKSKYASLHINTGYQSQWYVKDMIQDIDNHNDALEKKIERESDKQLREWMDETIKEMHSKAELENSMEN